MFLVRSRTCRHSRSRSVSNLLKKESFLFFAYARERDCRQICRRTTVGQIPIELAIRRATTRGFAATSKRSFGAECDAAREGGAKLRRRYLGVWLKPPANNDDDERCVRACSRDEAGLGWSPPSGNAPSIKEGLVTDFFTRETWRAGKKSRLRKRRKLYGGRKTAPAAFLEAAKKTQFKTGRPGCRLCCALRRDGRPCGRLALREFRVCEAHGGFGMLAMRGKFQPSGRSAGFRAATVEGRSPPASFDLMRLRLYQEADERTRMRLVKAWQTPGWHVLVRQIQLRNI